MFEMTQKSVTIYTVDEQDFTDKKEALIHSAWKNCEYALTDREWVGLATTLKTNPERAIRILQDYAIELDRIAILCDAPVVNHADFSYDNINWPALETTIDPGTKRPYNFQQWGEVAQRLEMFIVANQKIDAIKLVRTAFNNAGLKEAKDWVEARWTTRNFDIS